MDGHARANRLKPAGIAHKNAMLRTHLLPALGHKRLDQISTDDVQRLKLRLHNKAPKTVNNALTVLNTLLKKAVEWGVIDRVPCTIRLLKTSSGSVDFYDFDEYRRLVEAANRWTTRRMWWCSWRETPASGRARCGRCGGSMLMLKKGIADRAQRVAGTHLHQQGNRIRYVPMTKRLREALRGHRHLRGERVLYRADGRSMTESSLKELVARAARLANLRNNGPHILRHTFCSHLAMRGAATRAIRSWQAIRTSARRSGICT